MFFIVVVVEVVVVIVAAVVEARTFSVPKNASAMVGSIVEVSMLSSCGRARTNAHNKFQQNANRIC